MFLFGQILWNTPLEPEMKITFWVTGGRNFFSRPKKYGSVHLSYLDCLPTETPTHAPTPSPFSYVGVWKNLGISGVGDFGILEQDLTGVYCLIACFLIVFRGCIILPIYVPTFVHTTLLRRILSEEMRSLKTIRKKTSTGTIADDLRLLNLWEHIQIITSIYFRTCTLRMIVHIPIRIPHLEYFYPTMENICRSYRGRCNIQWSKTRYSMNHISKYHKYSTKCYFWCRVDQTGYEGVRKEGGGLLFCTIYLYTIGNWILRQVPSERVWGHSLIYMY